MLWKTAGETLPIKIYCANNDEKLMPAYETSGSSGMDLKSNEDVTIQPGCWAAVGTGVYVSLYPGLELQVRPRSGLALKKGITFMNCVGTIDADYRGEIKLIIHNHGDAPFEIKKYDRIGQMVLGVVPRLVLEPVSSVDELTPTERGSGGFGSTGV